MCVIDTNGDLRLKTGEIIRNANLEGISKEGMMELYENKMTMYDGLAIRRNIHELRNDIQKIYNKLDENLDEIKFHTQRCPINEDKINNMIVKKMESDQINEILEDKWVDILKAKVITVGNVAKALTAIIVLFLIILGIKEAVFK